MHDGLVGKEKGGGGGKWLLTISDCDFVGEWRWISCWECEDIKGVFYSAIKWDKDDAEGGAWIFKQGY